MWEKYNLLCMNHTHYHKTSTHANPVILGLVWIKVIIIIIKF